MARERVETRIGRHVLSIETGQMAKQAGGAAVVRFGDTVVLVTACSADPRPGVDFFPLRADYREMTYAAGKFPGGFWKREGRPTPKETLTCRLMDRPIRPLFPPGYNDEVQIVGVVLSADRQNDPDVLSMVGASAALTLSPIPFLGPMGAVRVGRVDGQLVINPTHSELDNSDIEIVVAGTETEVVMMEGLAREVVEDEIVDAVMFGQRAVREIVRIQKELAALCGREARPEVEPPPEPALMPEVEGKYYDRILDVSERAREKSDRRDGLHAIRDEILAEYCQAPAPEEAVDERAVSDIFSRLERKALRELILRGTRSGGRGLRDIRDVTCEVSVLPRVHGSALFTRGETQALVTCTLGTTMDEQRVDGLTDEYRKKFMLDYNFPPFSVGEVRMMRGPTRREHGHGSLAERSLEPMLPPTGQFPYTVRIVSDILESNGSSSMASVCGGTLCLMDAGVPIKDPVAGIAMGMVKEGDKVCILSDITGEEDHFGDMDLKVAGTQRGITGIQMDLKVGGVKEETILDALLQAKEGRIHILREMLAALDKPRPEISRYAPRLLQIKIDPEKIGMVIGPGGKVIKKLQDETQSNIEIEDDGTVTISSLSADGAEQARQAIERITEEPEVGKTYLGRVMSVKEFGAFVEILPGRDGLVHISELSDSYVESVSSICKVGDEMLVKLISVDEQNRIRLSRKAALKEKS